MPMIFSPLPRKYFSPSQRWKCFSLHRTKKEGGDHFILYENLISANWQRNLTKLEIIQTIAAAARPPIPVDSLDKCLEQYRFARGGNAFGWTGDKIEEIVSYYPGLRWWLSKRGLVIAMVGPQDLPLSEFNRRAGELMRVHFLQGKLSMEGLTAIAAALDTAGFNLKDNLQPAQWKPLMIHNQKFSRAAIRTFSAAINNKKFVHSIRRRLYRARDRFEKSYRAALRP
jgi:hypothetical protein